MSLVCVASQDGSPGATTTSLLLAGLWPKSQKRKVLLEADPSGGRLAATYHLSLDPDLATLVKAINSGLAPKRLWRHTQLLPGSTEAVVSPPNADDVHRILEADGLELGRWLDQLGEIDVFADIGSLEVASPCQSLASTASSVLMVVRPVADQLRSGAERMGELKDSNCQVSWVLIGDAPYCVREVEAAYGFPVMAVLADDAAAALALRQGAGASRLAKAPLIQTARKLVGALHDELSASAIARSVLETIEHTAIDREDLDSHDDGESTAVQPPIEASPPPTKPAPDSVSGLDDDATVAVPGPGVGPDMIPPSVVPPLVARSSSVDPLATPTPEAIDPKMIPPSLLPPLGQASGVHELPKEAEHRPGSEADRNPPTTDSPGVSEPAMVPPSLPSPLSGDAERSEDNDNSPQTSPAVSGQPRDPDDPSSDDPFSDDPSEELPSEELVSDAVGAGAEPVQVSEEPTAKPMSRKELWDVTTRLAAPPVPLRYSVAQDRLPDDSSEPQERPQAPVDPPMTEGAQEAKSQRSTSVRPDMEITEVIDLVGTPTGKDDVPPSLLPGQTESKDGVEAPVKHGNAEEHEDGRPASLLDAKLSTSANPAEELPGYPPID